MPGLSVYGVVPEPFLVPTLGSPTTLASMATGATGRPIWPSDISGLVLWLPADQIQGIASGASLSLWTDSSASLSHATQPSVLSQPLFITNVRNGLSAISFGVTAATVMSSPTSLHDSCTVALVGFPSGLTTATERWLGGRQGTSDRLTKQSSGTTQMAITKWLQGSTMASSPSLTAWQAIIVFTQVGSVSSTTMSQNGTIIFDNSGTTSGVTSTLIDIGMNNTSTITISAYIGEICIWNRPLFEIERSSLESYFRTKWAV